MSVSANIERIKSGIPETCTLVAVSKTKPNEMILEALNGGHLDFGENKVQELTKKAEELPKNIRWHYIGHLQRNKVKYIAPFVHLIHGVDSERLLLEINKQGEKLNRVISCLLQIHIAEEETKFGLSPDEAKYLIATQKEKLNYIAIEGLMGMATHTSDQTQIRKEFHNLYNLHSEYSDFKYLSMGMSGDYKIALDEGSNMIRIGSAIFGARQYH